MPENNVKIILEAVDKTGSSIKDLESNVKSSFASMSASVIKFVASAAAISGAIKALKTFINAAAEAQEIESRMAFQIETVGIKYGKVKDAIDAFANSLQLTTRFSDELAREGIGQMMQYTSDLEEAMNGVRLAMDMATQTGMDFRSMLRYVGMAMGGDVEILGRYVPELRNLNEVLGANATKAEKSAYAMDLLNKKFGGGAQQDLKTYNGALQQMGNALGDIAEAIGKKMLPFFENWYNGVRIMLKMDEQAAEAAKKLEKNMAGVREESEKAAQLAMRRTPNWIKEWVAQFDPLKLATKKLADAFEGLGIESQASLAKGAAQAIAYVEKIKKAFGEGKATVEDYKAAMIAATQAIERVTGPDKTKQLADLFEQSQKQIEEISPEDPDRAKKIQAITDQWLEARGQIIQSVQDIEASYTETVNRFNQIRIEPGIDTGPAASALKDLEAEFQAMRRQAERPIRVKIEVDSGEIKSFRKQMEVPIMGEVHFFGVGSTKKDLSDKIDEIIAEFGGIDEAISHLEAVIDLTELTMAYHELEKQLQQLEMILPTLERAVTAGGGISMYTDPYYVAQIMEAQEMVREQMRLLEMQMELEMLRAYGGSYQTGTPYVPRTGLYTLHEGERVIPPNQVSMGNIELNVTIPGAGDPRVIADALLKAFKYKLKGELGDFFKNR